MKRPVVPVIVLLLVSLLAATPAEAQYEDVDFTVVVTDSNSPQIPDDWMDIKEIAIGETDGKLVFRTTLGAAQPTLENDARFRISIHMTVPAGDEKTISFKPDGGLGSHPEPADEREACVADGAVYYCTLALGGTNTQLKAGDVLSDVRGASQFLTSGISDQCHEGTCTGPIPTGEFTSAGEYTIIGSGTTGPETIEETITDAEAAIEVVGDGSSKVYVYNWTNDFDALAVDYNITVAGGSVSINASVANTSVLDQTFAESAEGTLPIEDAAQGVYTITITLDDLNGTVKLDIKELQDAAGGAGGDATDTDATDATDADAGNVTDSADGNGSTNATIEETEGLPSPGVALVVGSLGLLVAAIRRRD